jgi:hypothetical protein
LSLSGKEVETNFLSLKMDGKKIKDFVIAGSSTLLPICKTV